MTYSVIIFIHHWVESPDYMCERTRDKKIEDIQTHKMTINDKLHVFSHGN